MNSRILSGLQMWFCHTTTFVDLVEANFVDCAHGEQREILRAQQLKLSISGKDYKFKKKKKRGAAMFFLTLKHGHIIVDSQKMNLLSHIRAF